jgi:(3,5-dihydroxyphenyl)acetyl-CoA 1,2-dioxygenase
MEASGSAKIDQADPKVVFGNAGLSPKAGGSWMKTRLDFGRNFKRAAAAAARYWRSGADFLSKLPAKPKRTREQQLAADIIQQSCRNSREKFIANHADFIYRKLTKNLDNYVRVVDLPYDAAKLVPGLTPTRAQVAAESALLQSEKDGIEVIVGGRFRLSSVNLDCDLPRTAPRR